MAELIVRVQCRSALREGIDSFLSLTFPVWGIAAPVTAVVTSIIVIWCCQTGDMKSGAGALALGAAGVFITLVSLMTKRGLLKDMLVMDRHGIRLPRLLGFKINLLTYIPWKQISSLCAIVPSDTLADCRLIINRQRGGPLYLSANVLGLSIVEQIVLAAKMWSQSINDSSLDELQDVLRRGARQISEKSYTDLWEEELGRRFCPSAYIPLEPGRVIRNNTLKVVSHLASGGLSALYLCQLNGNKLVVLKEAVVPDDSPDNIREKARELFDRESELLMKLDNPGVVHVLDSFCEAARNYMVLEYVNGIDLRQLVQQNGPQKESEVLEWALQIATVLKYLHERDHPIIHRDLTPDNIVLRSDGKIVVVDFGAANEYIGNATGTFVGKQSFIAPEQLRGKATVQSDIYAFGCTLFFLLTGREPEALSTSNPRELVPGISSELAELVESCTQLEARDRYQTVAQLLPVLRRMAAQIAIAPGKTS